MYNSEEDAFEIVGELDLSNEDIWKDNISKSKKTTLEGEILFDIYRSLYSSTTNNKRIK